MTHAPISDAELLTAARAALGPHVDARVAAIFHGDGTIAIEHDVAEWEASSGHVRSHRVRIGVSARALGAVRAHPHVEDEVTRIVSAAVASRAFETVGDVSFHFDPDAETPTPAGTAYRGAAPVAGPGDAAAGHDWAALAAEYFRGTGDDAMAAIATAPGDATAPQRVRMAACLRDLREGRA